MNHDEYHFLVNKLVRLRFNRQQEVTREARPHLQHTWWWPAKKRAGRGRDRDGVGDRPWLCGVRQAGAPAGGGPGRRAGKVAATPLNITILGDHQLKPHHICPAVLISCHAEVFPASRRPGTRSAL
ncbi:hypothetical protein Pcinc_023611 [Petrolisthes cinctipes]|uniref:Uncharacterized protein n=1 Tax=Petrolisthes cinctipes TaxID=88211 RepID=A0AAE1KGJ2_PETCI|nr:hypothetical protein Pcinc_023611 [Petrolisthes cinctipes]